MNKITVTLMTYSALLFGGGLIGFLKAGSLPSLIMSTLFAALILASIYLQKTFPSLGYKPSFTLLLFLSIFFLYRVFVTGKFMPAGMLAIISLAVLTFLFIYTREIMEG